MSISQIRNSISCGELHVADLTEDSAYIYYEPEPTGEKEHAAHYIKQDGVWVFENSVCGDLEEAIGGERAVSIMLLLLGMENDPNYRLYDCTGCGVTEDIYAENR